MDWCCGNEELRQNGGIDLLCWRCGRMTELRQGEDGLWYAHNPALGGDGPEEGYI